MNEWKEPVDQQPLHLVASQFDLNRAADQPRAGARQVDGKSLRRPLVEQRFLHLPRSLHEHRPLPRFELAFARKLSLDMLGQSEVKIVAAEDQMLADRDPMKLRLALAVEPDVNEREIRRAAADIANQDLLPGTNQLLPIRAVALIH